MGVSKDIDEVRRRLMAMARSASATTFPAKVVSVDETARTCVVDDDGVTYDDVLLFAVKDSSLKGMTVTPSVGSRVLVTKIAGSNMLYVSMYSQIEAAMITIGDKCSVSVDSDKVEVTTDQITFNGGDNGGLVILQKVQDNLNQLKDYVTAMNNAISAGFTGVGEGLAATGSGGNGAYSGAMAGKSITFSPMENSKVKH